MMTGSAGKMTGPLIFLQAPNQNIEVVNVAEDLSSSFMSSQSSARLCHWRWTHQPQ